jgi:hypothetical protein
MRAIGRLVVVAFGLLLAIAAATLVLFLSAVLDPVMALLTAELMHAGAWALADAIEWSQDADLVLGGAAAGLARMAAAILVAPSVLVALAGEVLGWRRLAWQAGATAVITAAMPWLARPSARLASPDEVHVTLVLGLAGAAAGFVYWLVAGRSAGGPRAARPIAPTSPGS